MEVFEKRIQRNLVILQNKLDDKVCFFFLSISLVSVLLEKGRGLEKGIGSLSPRLVNSITSQLKQKTQTWISNTHTHTSSWELNSSLLMLTCHNINSKWSLVLCAYTVCYVWALYGSEVNLPNGGLDLSGGPFHVKWFIPGVSWSGSVLHWKSSPIPVPLLFLQDLSCRPVAVFTLHHMVKCRLHRHVAVWCCPARPRTSSGHGGFLWMNDTGTQEEIVFALYSLSSQLLDCWPPACWARAPWSTSFTRRKILVDRLVLLVNKLDHCKSKLVGFFFTYILHTFLMFF